MSDKTLRAINKGRRKAGLKPIRRKKESSYPVHHGTSKSGVHSTKKSSIKNTIRKNMRGHEAKGSGSWKKGVKC